MNFFFSAACCRRVKFYYVAARIAGEKSAPAPAFHKSAAGDIESAAAPARVHFAAKAEMSRKELLLVAEKHRRNGFAQ